MASTVIVNAARTSVFTINGNVLAAVGSASPSLPSILVANAQGNEGTSINVRVSITSVTGNDVTFDYSTADVSAIAGEDYTTASGVGTITAGNLSVDIPVSTTDEDGFTGPKTLSFIISNAATNGNLLSITNATSTVTILDTDAPSGDHGYYESLIARPDLFTSLSFRNQAEINAVATDAVNYSSIYDPLNDTEPNAQDAMKCTIPAKSWENPVILGPAGLDDTALEFVAYQLNNSGPELDVTGFNAKGSQIFMGDEVMISWTGAGSPYDRTTGVVKLSQRGAYGTTATSHAAGTPVYRMTNNLQSQVRPILETRDGNTYFFTWDVYYTESWLHCDIGTYKAFQFTSNGAIWLEPQMRFQGTGNPGGYDPDVHIGTVGMLRSYNGLSGGNEDYSLNVDSKNRPIHPSATGNNPIEPAETTFMLVHPNRWVRHFVEIEQNEDDWDYVSMWVADEVQGPIQTYDRFPINVRGSYAGGVHNPPEAINKFYIEFNTSTAYLPEGRTLAYPSLGLAAFRPLIAYVRNFVALENPGDISSLLVRP